MPSGSRLEQRLGVFVPGRRKDLRRRALFNDDAALHHRDAVADLGCDPQVVGDEEHRKIELAAHLVQKLQHLVLYRDIQRRNRLIANQKFRLLPEPDSPTMPSVSPRRSVSDTLLTALTMRAFG